MIPSAAPFETGLSGKATYLRKLSTLTPEEISERQRGSFTHDLEANRKAAAIVIDGKANADEKALHAPA